LRRGREAGVAAAGAVVVAGVSVGAAALAAAGFRIRQWANARAPAERGDRE